MQKRSLFTALNDVSLFVYEKSIVKALIRRYNIQILAEINIKNNEMLI